MGAGSTAADIFDPLGLFHSDYKKRKKAAEKEQARQSLLAYKSLETVEAEKARTMSAEDARMEVMGLFGAPGTFEDTPGTAGAGATGSIYDTTSDRAKKSQEAAGLLTAPGLVAPKFDAEGNKIPISKREEAMLAEAREGILDPKAYAGKVSESEMFKIRSQLTSEARQLLNQEGPAWDMLQNSTLGAISEGAALELRETTRFLRNQMAKGGTARKTAFNDVQKILAMERSNRGKVHATWQANLQLHEYARKNANDVETGNYRFLDNLPHLRQAYGQSMSSLAELMTQVAVPMASDISSKGYQMQAAVQKPKVLQKLVMGVVSAVAGYYTGGAAKGLMNSMDSGPADTAVAPSTGNTEWNVRSGFGAAQ